MGFYSTLLTRPHGARGRPGAGGEGWLAWGANPSSVYRAGFGGLEERGLPLRVFRSTGAGKW
jgi:hypothetical protein